MAKKRTRLEQVRLQAEESYDYLYMNTPEEVHEVIRKFGQLRFEEGLIIGHNPELGQLGEPSSPPLH